MTRVTAGALLASVALSVAIVFALDQPRRELDDVFRVAILLAAGAIASALPWLRQQLFLRMQSNLASQISRVNTDRSLPEAKAAADSKYYTLTLATFIVAECLVLLGFVMAFMSGIPWAVMPFALGGATFMAVFFPREAERDELLHVLDGDRKQGAAGQAREGGHS